MMYLVDANVLSEPTKPAPNSKVVEWLTLSEGNLVVDSIILGALCIGILALQHDLILPSWVCAGPYRRRIISPSHLSRPCFSFSIA
jgi:predicted nucleic acid-binding protein